MIKSVKLVLWVSGEPEFKIKAVTEQNTDRRICFKALKEGWGLCVWLLTHILSLVSSCQASLVETCQTISELKLWCSSWAKCQYMEPPVTPWTPSRLGESQIHYERTPHCSSQLPKECRGCLALNVVKTTFSNFFHSKWNDSHLPHILVLEIIGTQEGKNNNNLCVIVTEWDPSQMFSALLNVSLQAREVISTSAEATQNN